MSAIGQIKSLAGQIHRPKIHFPHPAFVKRVEKLLADSRFWIIIAIAVFMVGFAWLLMWLASKGTGPEGEVFDPFFL